MTDTRHGHVIPREDGYKARCGGPGLCSICNAEIPASIRFSDSDIAAMKPPPIEKFYTQAELDAAVQKERERCVEWIQQQQAPLAHAQLVAGYLVQTALEGIEDGLDPLA